MCLLVYASKMQPSASKQPPLLIDFSIYTSCGEPANVIVEQPDLLPDLTSYESELVLKTWMRFLKFKTFSMIRKTVKLTNLGIDLKIRNVTDLPDTIIEQHEKVNVLVFANENRLYLAQITYIRLALSGRVRLWHQCQFSQPSVQFVKHNKLISLQIFVV
jgi:hypothetical protein